MTQANAGNTDEPDFADLSWSSFGWSTSVFLPAWRGFQSRLGTYGSQSSVEPSDGVVPLDVESPHPNFSVSAAQKLAYRYLVENDVAIKEAILKAVYREYPQWQEQFGYEGDEQAEFMPNIESTEELKALMGVSVVHVLTVEKDGISYVGFEFGCTWDDEHGLGALTHKERVVSVGGADTAFLSWLAEQDGGMDEQAQAELQKLKLPLVEPEPEPRQLGLFDQ